MYLIIHSATGQFKEKYGEKYLIIDSIEAYENSLINLNCVEFKYYPFMISLDKGSGSCNVITLDSTKHFQTSCNVFFPKKLQYLMTNNIYRKRNKRHK